jgi:hypothetical protein
MSYKEYERMMVIENVWVPIAKAVPFIGGLIVFIVVFV